MIGSGAERRECVCVCVHVKVFNAHFGCVSAERPRPRVVLNVHSGTGATTLKTACAEEARMGTNGSWSNGLDNRCSSPPPTSSPAQKNIAAVRGCANVVPVRR